MFYAKQKNLPPKERDETNFSGSFPWLSKYVIEQSLAKWEDILPFEVSGKGKLEVYLLMNDVNENEYRGKNIYRVFDPIDPLFPRFKCSNFISLIQTRKLS